MAPEQEGGGEAEGEEEGESYVEQMKRLREEQKDEIEEENRKRAEYLMATTLQRYAAKGDVDGIKKTLDDGADIHGQDMFEQTALHLAATNNRLEASRELTLSVVGENSEPTTYCSRRAAVSIVSTPDSTDWVKVGLSRLRLITAMVARSSKEGEEASSYSIRMSESVKTLGVGWVGGGGWVADG